MKIEYSNEADILMIELRDGSPSDSIDLKDGIPRHLDEKGGEIIEDYPEDEPYPNGLLFGLGNGEPFHVVAALDAENTG